MNNGEDFPMRWDDFGKQLGDILEIEMERRAENREAFRKIDDMVSESEQLIMSGFA